MAYRTATLNFKAGDSSSLDAVLFDRLSTFYQTKDLETFSTFVRIGTADAETTIAIAPVTTGYFIALFSDYPIKVRLNGASETQFTMKSNNVTPVSTGAPAPDQCVLLFTGTITAVRLEPISGAAQTANVKIFISGDPANSYV